MTTNPRNSGNVLFLILIAVALFAALAYAVTSSSRSGGGDISKEKASALASQILNHGIAVRTAVTRMTMNGIAIENLDAYSPVYIRKNGNVIMDNSSCVTNNCLIFHPDGGGVSPVIIGDSWAINNEGYALTSGGWRPGHAGLQAVSIAGIGSDKMDIILSRSWYSREFCKAFNDFVGVTNPSNLPPVDAVPIGQFQNFSASTIFDTEPGIALGDEAVELIGKDAFCYSPTPAYTSGVDTNNYAIVIVVQSR